MWTFGACSKSRLINPRCEVHTVCGALKELEQERGEAGFLRGGDRAGDLGLQELRRGLNIGEKSMGNHENEWKTNGNPMENHGFHGIS